MSTPPHPIPPTCTHERRPGTTVCLLCRQEARVAASDRRKKWLLRGTAIGIVVIVVVVVMSSAAFLRERAAAKQSGEADSVAFSRVDAAAASAEPITPEGSRSATSTSPSVPTVLATPDPGVFPPVIRAGETALQFGVTASRSDSGIVVTFDTPELRTRMPEKFERFLRWSLPQVYGPQADSVLAHIPLGKLAAQGNLLYDLPTNGIHVPVNTGWHLEIYPEIRPGQDGPLVVRYRSSVVKN